MKTLQGIFAVATTFILIPACNTNAPEVPTYKNVVVIVGDDHAYTTLGAYGNRQIRTPHLDELAGEGVRFTNAYATSPLCSASRQSLLTGKYPHQTGVSLLFTPFNDATNTTIAEHLKPEGFSTGLFGKAHFNSFIWWELYNGDLPHFGFDTLVDNAQYRQWLVENPRPPIPDSIATYTRHNSGNNTAYRMNADVLPQPVDDAHSQGTFLARSAINFIKEQGDNRFLVWLAFHEPHAPFAFPIEYRNRYHPDSMPLPEGSPEDDRWIPERFRNLTERERRGIIASYYTSVEYMDSNVGRVMDALEKQGILDETLVVYLGDQGYLLNDHKRFEKHTMWSESIKAPLIFRGAGLPENQEEKAIVEFTDVAPTICELLDVPPMEEASGTGLAPLLTGQTDQGKPYAFAEFLEDNKAMIATRKWKYIFTTGKRDLGQGYETGRGPSGIYHRLYNLQNDPGETSNLAYKDSHGKVVDSLQHLMLDHFKKTHPYADELPVQLNDTGKLVWFCEPRDVGAEYGGKPLRTFTRE